ncbi:PAS domain-containing protein [Ferrovibrio sp.]|uniref:PAS domain-containing protein n=1 Tax=Ferrovibrio sp. TaxID=1917215 RepID=UPI003D132073
MYPAPLDKCLPELRALYDYWRGKRQGRPFPARAEIEPLEIPRLLEHIGLIDVTGDGEDYHYRLVGTGIARAFGEDPTGRQVGASTGGSYANVIRDACRRCWETAQPVLFRGVYRTREHNYLWAERLLLPLGVAARPNMLLFCLVLRQTETDYRLENTRIELLAEPPE